MNCLKSAKVKCGNRALSVDLVSLLLGYLIINAVQPYDNISIRLKQWQQLYARLSTHMVFNDSMESDLASHIGKLSQKFHGLGPLKCRQLAYTFAKFNGLKMPESWSRHET